MMNTGGNDGGTNSGATITKTARFNMMLSIAGGAGRGAWVFDDPGLTSTFPGRIIRFRNGETLSVTFNNSSPLPHTIHLHGLDADQANDGEPDTSPAVQSGQSFTYVVPPSRYKSAGSYWYHCHVNATWHVESGLYGALIIDPADGSKTAWDGGPAYDVERVWVLHTYDQAWHVYMRPPNLAKSYAPDLFMINGKQTAQASTAGDVAATVAAGQALLVRLINPMYLTARVSFGGLSFDVIASDGRPYRQTETLSTIDVDAAQRYDVMLKPTVPGTYTAKVDYLDWYTRAVLGSVTTPITVT